MSSRNTCVEPGLHRITRDNGVEVWLAVANGITLYSYSEAYAREWLERERSCPPPEAA